MSEIMKTAKPISVVLKQVLLFAWPILFICDPLPAKEKDTITFKAKGRGLRIGDRHTAAFAAPG